VLESARSDSRQTVDIINVVSVTMPATVVQWIESDDDKIQDALYWRQAFDFRNSQLSVSDLMFLTFH
jgi:hypothetical protein